MQMSSITVAELLRLPTMRKCKLVAGSSGIDRREIRRINMIDTPDIANWMLGEEFLMTTAYVMRDNPLEIKDLIVELNNKNVSALGIKLGRFINTLPEEVLRVADELEFPLLSLPMECSFSEVVTEVMEILSKNQPRAEVTSSWEFDYQDYIAGSFLEMMVTGKGINEILKHLKTLINVEVAYLDYKRQSIFVTNENSEFYEKVISKATHELQSLFHVFPLKLAGESFGLIVINSARDEIFPVSWHSSINFAKTAIIMNLQKEIAVRNAELKYKDSFLKDLMFHHIHPEDDTMEEKTASFFGTSFLPPFVVMILDRDNIATYEGDGDDRAKQPRLGIQMREEIHARVYNFLKVHFGRVHYTSIGGKMVVLVSLWPALEKNLEQLEHLIDRFRSEYRDETGETLSVAVGNTVNEIFDVAQSYKQAKTCIDFAKSSGIENAFFSWSKLGIMRLLFAASNNKTNRDEIRIFVEKYLGKLKELPSKESIRQLETLEALSKKGWNLKDTARALHVHYNTVRYRLKMLEELIPFNLEDPEVRVEIYVALKLYYINNELNYF